jgi:AraC-like DNA-binding protein
MLSQLARGRDMLELDDGSKHPVPEGALMVVAAGVRHRATLVTRTGLARWMHASYYRTGSLDLFALVELPPVAPARIGTKVGDAIAEWVAVQKSATDSLLLESKRQELGFKVLALLAPLCRPKKGAIERMAALGAMEHVVETLHARFAEDLSRDDLARLASLSPAQFHRTFFKAVGTTPVAYLRGLRIRRAQELLIATPLGVAEIGQKVGYADPFVFSKAFRSVCGTSPRSYREQTREIGPAALL